MDVMIPYQEGYQNIVAPMGTALTETHLQQLQRLTRRFILALDPDAAGIHATLRGMEVARETLDRQWEAVFDPRGLVGYEGRLNADIRVLSLPDGLDPDELILKNPKQWQNLIDKAQPVIRFYFEQQMKQHNPEEPKGKARIVDAMLPLLQDIANSVEREAYVQEISLKLGLDSRLLLDRLRVKERATAVRRQAATAAPSHTGPSVDLEAYILTILMTHPELMEQVSTELMDLELDPIVDEDFSAKYRLIWAAWLEMLVDPGQDLDDLLTPDLQALVRNWTNTPLPEASLEQWKRDLLRAILKQRQKRLRELSRQVQGLVIEAQQEGDLRGRQYANTFHRLLEELRRVQHALA
jgi:DNA primase